MPFKQFIPSQLYSNPKQALIAVFLLRFVMLSFALLASIFVYVIISESLLSTKFILIMMIGILYSLISLLRLGSDKTISNNEIFFHIFIDTVFVVALVSLSGGTSNPFIYYLLVLIALTSLLFEQRWTWLYSALAISCYSVLFYFDIESHLNHSLDNFQLHLVGMWVNFVGSALLIHFVISVLTKALKEREKLLAFAREENLRNEQIIGLGAIAASTVHALRTPLSTIAVTLSDLKNTTIQDQNELNKDFDLLLQQVERCKQTTNKLASLAELSYEQTNESVSELANFLKEHYLLTHSRIMPEFIYHAPINDNTIEGNILLKQALINLIDNAIHAAIDKVSVDFSVSDSQLIISIKDNGPGFSNEVIENWGRPLQSQKPDGLGIGLFLAKTNVERFSGSMNIVTSNKKSGGHVEIYLPLVKPDIQANASL